MQNLHLPAPYIGVTGFMSADEIWKLALLFPQTSKHIFMAGVLASSKTLQGEQNRYPHRYPNIDDLPEVFAGAANNDNILPLLHYATDDPETLLEQMLTVHALAGSHCQGFQLNVVWPDPAILAEYRDRTSSSRNYIVLQCGARAMREMDNNFSKLAQRIEREYNGLIDYVLIDPSGGTGTAIDLNVVHDALCTLNRVLWNTAMVGIAGGLEASRMKDFTPLAHEYTFCVDAEGRLRDEADQLDLEKARQFITEAKRALCVS